MNQSTRVLLLLALTYTYMALHDCSHTRTHPQICRSISAKSIVAGVVLVKYYAMDHEFMFSNKVYWWNVMGSGE